MSADPSVDGGAGASVPASDSASASAPSTLLVHSDLASSSPLSPLSPSATNADGTPLSPGTQQKVMVREMQRERKRSMVLVDGWIDVQEKTFLRWCNFQLSKRKLKISDLKSGLSDGVNLCALLEVLSKRSLPGRPNKNAKSQIVRLDNLRLAFDFLEAEHVHLVNVRPGDIEQGNIKIILGLVWSLIKQYQIMSIAQPKPASSPDAQSSASAQPSPPPAQAGESSTKGELLKWVNEQIASFDVGTASDFGKSWQDGRVLSALVESLDPASSRQLHLSGEAVEDIEAAIHKAESLYAIPALMDASDIAGRPQEHSLMTYISLFREVSGERDAAEAARNAEEAAARKADADAVGQAAQMELPMSPAVRVDEELEQQMDVTVPLSPLRIFHTSEEVDGAVSDGESADELRQMRDGGGHERNGSGALTAEELASMAERTRADTHPALVGAYIDSQSLEEAVSPRKKKPQSLEEEDQKAASAAAASASPVYDSEEQAKRDALSAPLDIERDTEEMHLPGSSPAAGSGAAEAKADLNAPQDYQEPAEDAEGKRAGETLQQSIDRRIEKMMNAIEICIVTPDHKYLQSDVGGNVRAHELNTAAATWTILDGNGGWKFIRDYQSRYLACDADGRVYTSQKKPECRFRIIRGTIQHFVDMHGRYLTVLPAGGRVRSEPNKGDSSKFRICFPVVEGVLEKKGTSGFHRWQERYFAFNGNVMSYWRQKKAVGKERPSGIYHPARMQSVNINRTVARRFNIVFQDGKIVELLAPDVEQCCRWVRALNSRGIKTVQQSKRMSVVNEVAAPVGQAKSAPVAAPVAAPIKS